MSFSETGTDTVPEHVARVVMTPPPPDSPFAAAHWKGSCDLGQLTLKGALQQQVLGRALRGIYVDRFKLLSNHWDPDQLWVRSTSKEHTHTPTIFSKLGSTPRTPSLLTRPFFFLFSDLYCPTSLAVERVKQSAENLIEGLYNESTRSQIAGGHPSTFSILMYPSSIDYLTMPTGPCPRISELQDEQKAPKNKVLEKIERDNMAFMKKLGDWMGFEGGTGDYIEATMPRSCNGFPLQCRLPSSTPKTKRDGSQQEEVGEEDKETKEQDPENCVTQAIIDRVIDIDSQISAETLRDDPGAFTILQLGMGSLVKDIRDNIQAAVKDGVQNTTSPAFRLYSGHDTTILPMLAVFDSLDLNWPPFVSCKRWRMRFVTQPIVRSQPFFTYENSSVYFIVMGNARHPTSSSSFGRPHRPITTKVNTLYASFTTLALSAQSRLGVIWHGVLWTNLSNIWIVLWSQICWLNANPRNQPRLRTFLNCLLTKTFYRQKKKIDL